MRAARVDTRDAIHERVQDSPAASPATRARSPQASLALHRSLGNRVAQRIAATSRRPTSAPTPSTGTGMPLPPGLRHDMERSFGASFDGVRVHVGGEARRIGAIAYTQGRDIHVSPDAYAPATRAGRALLGHELAHVVQQAAGRVAPTRREAGIELNDEPTLEREAHEAGVRAARGEVAALRGGRGIGATPGPVQRAVVQRAIGFEFETGWLVDHLPFDAAHDDVEVPSAAVPFSKKDVVSNAKFDGFRMEADEAGGGRTELEFVIRPPIEESVGGLKRLEQVMQQMVQIGAGLRARFNNQGRPFALGDVTKEPFDALTLITPAKDDPELRAGPQATTGLDLAAIPAFVKNQLHAPPKNAPKFNGFLTLVKQYVERGTREGGALSYPKIIAEPLLARTNFVGLLALVEPEVILYYTKNPMLWVPDVLAAIGLPKIGSLDILARGVVDDDDRDTHANFRLQILDAQDSLRTINAKLTQIDQELLSVTNDIPTAPTGITSVFSSKPSKSTLLERQSTLQSQKDHALMGREELLQHKAALERRKRALETYAGFTVARWLSGLLVGEDLLSTIPDAESLGEFGTRTEKIGKAGDVDAGIFEYRGAQTNKIPLQGWPDFALDFFRHILKLHGH